MNDEMKIKIDEMVKEIKNSKKLQEIYKIHEQYLEILNNALMIGYLKDSEMSEKDVNNKIDRLVVVANQVMKDLIKKDFDEYEILIVLYMILDIILYSHPEIKDASKLLGEKLKEEVIKND